MLRAASPSAGLKGSFMDDCLSPFWSFRLPSGLALLRVLPAFANMTTVLMVSACNVKADTVRTLLTPSRGPGLLLPKRPTFLPLPHHGKFQRQLCARCCWRLYCCMLSSTHCLETRIPHLGSMVGPSSWLEVLCISHLCVCFSEGSLNFRFQSS